MTCNDIQAKITDLLFNELGGGDVVDLRRHIDSCAECRGVQTVCSTNPAMVAKFVKRISTQ